MKSADNQDHWIWFKNFSPSYVTSQTTNEVYLDKFTEGHYT